MGSTGEDISKRLRSKAAAGYRMPPVRRNDGIAGIGSGQVYVHTPPVRTRAEPIVVSSKRQNRWGIIKGRRKTGSQDTKADKIKPSGPRPVKVIEINFHIPKLVRLVRWRKPFQKLAQLPKIRVLGAVVVIAILLVVACAEYIRYHTNSLRGPAGPPTAQAQQATGKLVKGTPPYSTILPAGKSIDTLGGWTRVSPLDRDPVYAYVDVIKGVQIDVSEQPLPKSFQTGTAEAVAQLAQGFNADQKLTVGGVTAYVGTSAKGPQSVIMAKANLLILMKSTSPISNNEWASYINSLQ